MRQRNHDIVSYSYRRYTFLFQVVFRKTTKLDEYYWSVSHHHHHHHVHLSEVDVLVQIFKIFKISIHIQKYTSINSTNLMYSTCFDISICFIHIQNNVKITIILQTANNMMIWILLFRFHILLLLFPMCGRFMNNICTKFFTYIDYKSNEIILSDNKYFVYKKWEKTLLFLFLGSHEVNHWKNMIQSHRTAIAQWHSLKSRAQCDLQSTASRAIS